MKTPSRLFAVASVPSNVACPECFKHGWGGGRLNNEINHTWRLVLMITKLLQVHSEL